MSDNLDFTLPATGNTSFTLSEHRDKHLVIYFYPRDNTPGCTTESESFRDLYAEFQKQGCEIVGISRDSINSHEKFKNKLSLPFDLLSDADEQVCKLFNVMKQKNMYGKQVIGIERSTFIFVKGGKLGKEWRKVKVKDHVQEVLEYVVSLNQP